MSCKFTKIFALIILINNPIKAQEEINRIITLFVKQYPEIRKPGEPLINCGSVDMSFNSGVFATYAGYLNLTDNIGQLTFPRKTVNDSINILITTHINPVFMFKNTIAYWKIEKGFNVKRPTSVPAKMYKVERKYDLETQLFFWEVKERKLPKNGQIPLHTIIILADPENIDVPEGITVTTNNPQLILPAIYAKKNRFSQNALFAMSIKPFFSQNKTLYKERPLGYAAHIT